MSTALSHNPVISPDLAPALAPAFTLPHKSSHSIAWLAMCLVIPLLLVLAWDSTSLDSTVAHWYGTSAGFAWKDNALLVNIFHIGIRRACVGIALHCILAIWWPLGPWRRCTRRQRAWLACNIWVCAVGVAALKSVSLTSCPWDLQMFGDKASYVWHFASKLQTAAGAVAGVGIDSGPGHCFPSGHASSFFSFFPVFWLIHLYNPCRAWQVLAFVAVFGLMLSWVQVIRGAHFPSHVLWTMWLCWAVGAVTSPLLTAQPSMHYK
jgi:membrane-associated PAP2 superfamily phosphatase